MTILLPCIILDGRKDVIMSSDFEERKKFILGLTLDDVSKRIHYEGKPVDENLSKEELLKTILYLYQCEQLAISRRKTMCEECKAEDERGIEW